jgi:hypothetical protein
VNHYSFVNISGHKKTKFRFPHAFPLFSRELNSKQNSIKNSKERDSWRGGERERGISMIEVLSSCLVLPWEKRNVVVRGPCSFSSQSNFVTFRSLSFSSTLSDSVFSKGNVNPLTHLSLNNAPSPAFYHIYGFLFFIISVQNDNPVPLTFLFGC